MAMGSGAQEKSMDLPCPPLVHPSPKDDSSSPPRGGGGIVAK